MKTTSVEVIDVIDWDDLVIQTYGKKYSFQQQDGCKDRSKKYISVPCEPEDYENDTITEIINGDEMGVSFAAWLACDPLIKLPFCLTVYGNDFTDLWWSRNFYPHVSMLINDLYAKGLLEAGEYLI
jgi:hypothetical protein